MKDASTVMNRKDYTGRANVIKFMPWWIAKITTKEFTPEYAVGLLKAGKTIRFITDKDRKGLIQALEAKYELASV
jgi:hypothetical protein